LNDLYGLLKKIKENIFTYKSKIFISILVVVVQFVFKSNACSRKNKYYRAQTAV